MSFPIKLQKNVSPVNKVGKDISDIATATGTLRTGTSIIDPVIEIETALSENMISDVNYAYIEIFGRWYFVTDIVVNNNKLWTMTMHVDVLETYKATIAKQTAVVSRQENNYNLMLDDGWFMTYQDPKVQIRGFSNPTPFESQEFILVIAGS